VGYAVRAADAWARGSGGPNVSGGVRERAGREARRRRGTDTQACAAQCRAVWIQTGFQTKSEFKCFKLGSIRKVLYPSSERLKQNIVLKISER
jgi:hypothetical protein